MDAGAVLHELSRIAMRFAAERPERQRGLLRERPPHRATECRSRITYPATRLAWLMRQAYEGMLHAVETEPAPLRTDVRALGFLRPPWGLSYDALSASAWPDG